MRVDVSKRVYFLLVARSHVESKLCATCGRSFHNRRRHAEHWDEVRYCSERCRRNKPSASDRAIEASILAKLQTRRDTLSPSEVARELFTQSPDKHEERVRQAARRLVAKEAIEILQGGRVVDASAARGAIFLRLKRQ